MKKILLIEDDKTLRENTAIFLRKAGFEVETARDGELGMQKVLEFFPCLIICDIMMPKLNGYELFEVLQSNPSTAIIPFVFQTAKSEKEDIRKGMQLGADDYITKPYNFQELLESVNTRLEKHEKLLKFYEDKYKTLIENPISGVFIYQEDRFVHVNRKFAGMFGYAEKEMLQKGFDDIVSGEDRAMVNDKIQQLLMNITPGFDIEIYGLRKDGSQLMIELYGGLTKINGETALMGNALSKGPGEITDVENFLLKNIDKNELEKAIQVIARDGSYFSGITVSVKKQDKPVIIKDDSGHTKLSKRELEVLRHIAHGLKNHEIAEKMFVSQRTADWHRANLISKTGSKNTADLIMYAVKYKLVEL
ncbi:MAG: response regulator [Bacteroidota bacterium]